MLNFGRGAGWKAKPLRQMLRDRNLLSKDFEKKSFDTGIKGILRRSCPLCGADDAHHLITLKEANFTNSNPSYDLDQLKELDLPSSVEYPIVSCNQCEMVYSQYHLDSWRENFVYEHVISRTKSLNKVMTLKRRIQDTQVWLHVLKMIEKNGEQKNLPLKVADYGCGWGTLLQVARSAGIDVYGFDVTS